MTQVTTMERDETDSYPKERARPKVGRLPVTLRLLSQSKTAEEEASWKDADLVHRKSDTQFMLLLVTLFIIVNLTLITLLNHKDKTVAAKSEDGMHAQPHLASVLPALAIAPATSKQLPPAAGTHNSLTPVVAALPFSSSQSKRVVHAYVTSASPSSTQTTAAPIQPVTVSDHGAPASASSMTSAPVNEIFTVVHTQDPAPPLAVMHESSSSTTTIVSPESAKRDLLSVINKD